jgi:ABC-type transport system involved in cytochrome c biogenesis permease subunit
MAPVKTIAERHPSSGNLFAVLVGLAVFVLLFTSFLGAVKTGRLLTEANFLYAALIFFAAGTAFYLGFGVTGIHRYLYLASAATWAGFAATSAAIVHRWAEAGHPPFSNIYEMLLSFVWTLVGMTLLVERRYAVRALGTVTLPIATISMLLILFLPSAVRPLVPALQSTWLHVHVSLAMLAYAACAGSFALALMFLIRDGMKTELFLAGTSGLLVVIYAALATRFDGSGGLKVIAWDAARGQEMFFAERERLMVVIPELGWVFFTLLAAAIASLALVTWGMWNRAARAVEWANRVYFVSLLLQALALAAFVLRAGQGVYASPQTPGLFATSLRSSPFLLAGMLSGLFASVLYLLLLWRRADLERLLPSGEALDSMTYKTIGIAFPLLTLMIATGAYWANQTWGSYWSWDPKETWALITWLVYAGYLHMRITRGWRGRRAAVFAIVGFGVVLFTFFGVTYLLPGLHAYS